MNAAWRLTGFCAKAAACIRKYIWRLINTHMNISALSRYFVKKQCLACVATALLVLTTSIGAKPLIPAAPELAAGAWLLVDANTGAVLAEQNSEQQLPPASLTKMMTAFIVFDEIASGRIAEDSLVPVSVNAWKKGGAKSGGSTMFLSPNTEVSVIELLQGVIIQSGNDASIALAEHIAGGEEVFADVMNQQAQILGMANTNFENATGWPAEGHVSTARDMATLASAIINLHPEHYSLYSQKYFEYAGIRQPNRNQLLWRDASVDGLKTGHTEEAGYCLVSSAERNGMRMIAVVMGARSERSRATESQKLLAWGFRYYTTYSPYKAGAELSTSRVWKGQDDSISLVLADDLDLTIPRGAEDSLTTAITVDQLIKAPITAGQTLGELTLTLGDEVLAKKPLVAAKDIEKSGFFARLWDGLTLFIFGLLGKV